MRALVFVLLCSFTLAIPASRVSNIAFFIHAKVSKPNATAVIVAGPNGDTISLNFGSVYVVDDVITAAQSNTSAIIGRAKGMVMATEENLQYATYVFSAVLQNEKYNGTIAYQGTDRVVKGVSELAVVGGTGDFRLVTGYASIIHVELNLPDSTILINSTLYHKI